MNLVDTSVWVDHLRSGDAAMDRLLDKEQVLMHPFVLGEIALGFLDPRDDILETLRSLPAAEMAGEAEVLRFIETYRLFGTGIGYIDVHLLVSAVLSFSGFWTRDKRLRVIAEELGIAAKGLN